MEVGEREDRATGDTVGQIVNNCENRCIPSTLNEYKRSLLAHVYVMFRFEPSESKKRIIHMGE